MSLNTLKKQNSLANLLGAAEKENTPPKIRNHTLMNVCGNRNWIKQETVMQSFGFYQRSREKICLGQSFGITHFKVRLASGILRILSPHLDRKTPYQR